MDEQARFYGKYRGQVINDIDPMLAWRVQVRVPAVSEQATTWALPTASRSAGAGDVPWTVPAKSGPGSRVGVRGGATGRQARSGIVRGTSRPANRRRPGHERDAAETAARGEARSGEVTRVTSVTKPNEGGPVARPGASRLERYVAGVRFVAPIMPAIASAVMFIAYLLPAPFGRDAAASVLIGVIAAVIVAVVGGAIAIPSIRGRDRSQTFLELWERYHGTPGSPPGREESADCHPSRTPDERATAQLATSDVERIVAGSSVLSTTRAIARIGRQLRQPPGSEDWSGGLGYVGLWQLIHAAEEALLIVEPMTEVIAQALTDRRRLIGSTIPQAPALLAMQGVAVRGLDPAIAKMYFTAITESPDGGPGK